MFDEKSYGSDGETIQTVGRVGKVVCENISDIYENSGLINFYEWPNVFDFSVILIYVDEKRKYHILKRYNGKHIYKNQIEKNKFRDFHIHKATQRYPEAGFRIDGYAEVTDAYNNWKDALTRMLIDCNFKGDISFLNNFN